MNIKEFMDVLNKNIETVSGLSLKTGDIIKTPYSTPEEENEYFNDLVASVKKQKTKEVEHLFKSEIREGFYNDKPLDVFLIYAMVALSLYAVHYTTGQEDKVIRSIDSVELIDISLQIISMLKVDALSLDASRSDVGASAWLLANMVFELFVIVGDSIVDEDYVHQSNGYMSFQYALLDLTLYNVSKFIDGQPVCFTGSLNDAFNNALEYFHEEN